MVIVREGREGRNDDGAVDGVVDVEKE